METPQRPLEFQIAELLAEVLVAQGYRDVQQEPDLSGFRPDLAAKTNDGELLAFEIKMNNPVSPRAIKRTLNEVTLDAGLVATSAEGPRLVLVFPAGPLVPALRSHLEERGIAVWDLEYFQDLLRITPASVLSHRSNQIKERLLSIRPSPVDSPSSELGERLDRTPCGRKEWPVYQRLCADILAYLFCPPLEFPLSESRNLSGVNRRDIVLPNYATDGFWRFLHRAYHAEYIVVDAKNWCQRIGKTEILQLANYLSEAGAGLFGIVLTRTGEKAAAYATRREQWLISRKMILLLTDGDLLQMLANHSLGVPAENVIRQQLQDFRLSL